MHFIASDEVLEKALSWIGRPSPRLFKFSFLNQKRFKKFCGSDELQVAHLWAHLQCTDVQEALVSDAKEKDFKMFLLALHHLKNCPVLEVLAKTFGVCEDTASKWAHHCIGKIAALKESRIVWPNDFGPSLRTAVWRSL
jgi:hypothetical protein